MFKIGDRAVYPAQGVVEIKAIEAKEFSGEQNEFYILRIINTDMTIMVPIANAGSVGMRRLIDNECIQKIFGILGEKKPLNGHLASWSRRQKIYQDKIRSGNLLEVAEVLRELYYIKEDKDLSYGEKKFLEQARRLLIQEIAIAAGTSEKQVSEKVEKIFLH
jgi:CarD family transcriptional regulator